MSPQDDVPVNPKDDAAGLALDVAVRLPSGFALEVALSVAPGEVLAVVGPNGSGKTTLLRAVAGLVRSETGTIALAGRTLDGDAAFVPAHRRRVGYVFQDHRLFAHLDVVDNVAFAGALGWGPGRRGRRSATREDARAWLARLGLEGLERRRPRQLSGGQAQRVALARALAARPDVLLLDEPFAALDAATRRDVRAHLREHLAGFSGPVVLVTHDPLEALLLADRIAVLERGRLTQLGTPADVARRPASAYVARLMGLNLFRGTLSGAAGGPGVTLATGATLAVTLDPDEAAPPVGAEVLVAVSPSSIAVHRSRPEGSPRNVWRGRVAGLEPLTDRVRVAVEEADGVPAVLADLTPAAVAQLALVPGSDVWVSVKATEVLAYAAG
ncbi:MAG: ABC transporter ATP-binding protein [Kineosporiaceae bacterium]